MNDRTRPALLLLTALLPVGCGYSGPPCEDVAHSDMQVDTSSGAPVFSWSGDNANDLAVYAGAVSENYEAVWEVSCECEGNIENPDGNVGCKDKGDWD